MANAKPTDIDSYIAQSPEEAKEKLKQLRAIITKLVPDATEAISYGIPTFYLNSKYLVYFAGYKKHVAIYPVPAAEKGFEKDYAKYKTSGKGTIQFPLDEPLPEGLIARIVKYMVKERAERTDAGKQIRPKKELKKAPAKKAATKKTVAKKT